MGDGYDIERLSSCKVLVVGDVMLDRYLWGDVQRISPEAPVPVFHVRTQSEIPGGAGNVVSNLVNLGASVTVVGIRGQDATGDQLAKLLEDEKVQSHIMISPDRPTITKTRIVSRGQQMLRLDEEDVLPLNASLQSDIIEAVKAQLEGCNAVVLSDYGKGLLQSQELVQTIITLAKGRGVPTIVDPKGTNWDRYRGATCITPNTKELEVICGGTIRDDQHLIEVMRSVLTKYGLTWVVATRGPLGMCLMNRNEPAVFIPTRARQVYDVSGAGDTVIATLAVCVGVGLPFPDGAKIANLAAGIVVGKIGTQAINRLELESALGTTGVDAPLGNISHKLCSPTAAVAQIEAWKSDHQEVVFTNGCFDLLHPGHVHLLNEARNLGDRLVVAINSDASVRRIKGPSRPILSERDRASLVASLDCVDLVIVFDDNTPDELLKNLRPKILVKGADYKPDQVYGHDIVESYGGQVRLVPILDGYSTTEVASKILMAHGVSVN